MIGVKPDSLTSIFGRNSLGHNIASMRWGKDSNLPFRGTSSALKILAEEKKIDFAPSHETCIQWDLKIGLHKMMC